MGRGSGINDPHPWGALQFPLIHLMLTAALGSSSHHLHLPYFTGEEITERSSDSSAHPTVKGKVRPLTRSCLCYDFGKRMKWERHHSFLASCSLGQSP